MNKQHIIDNYENYKEEDRLVSNNARKVELLTTLRIFDEHISNDMTILDCAAGTGIYAFHYADKGNVVTATDLTPRHVDVMNNILKEKTYNMETAVMDAVDMSRFSDESFDVVLNMGPFYHLVDPSERKKCFEESIRVLKKGGLLITTYIPRFFIFQYLAMQNRSYLDAKLAKQLIATGELRHSDEKCFWTDTYYSSADEMENLYISNNLEVIDHFAQDGLAPEFSEQVDSWSNTDFSTWCDYHYSVCREKSTLGASNHVAIIGRKKNI